ncbi:MAG: hypothetical protein ACLR5P_11130 [[Eubacterium] siraeum]
MNRCERSVSTSLSSLKSSEISAEPRSANDCCSGFSAYLASSILLPSAVATCF